MPQMKHKRLNRDGGCADIRQILEDRIAAGEPIKERGL